MKITKTQIEQFVQQNKDLFVHGNTIEDTPVLKLAGIVKPSFNGLDYEAVLREAQRFQNQKVAIQTKINKVLASQGMYMAQKDRTKYYIKTVPETITRIKSYKTAASRKKSSATRLKAGLFNTHES